MYKYYKTSNLMFTLRQLERIPVQDISYNEEYSVFRVKYTKSFRPSFYLLSYEDGIYSSMKIKFSPVGEYHEIIHQEIDFSGRKKYGWDGGSVLILFRKNKHGKNDDGIIRILEKVVAKQDIIIKSSFLNNEMWDFGLLIDNLKDYLFIKLIHESGVADVFERCDNYVFFKDMQGYYPKCFTPWDRIIIPRTDSELAVPDMLLMMDGDSKVTGCMIPSKNFETVFTNLKVYLDRVSFEKTDIAESEKISLTIRQPAFKPVTEFKSEIIKQISYVNSLREQLRRQEIKLRNMESNLSVVQDQVTTPAGLLKVTIPQKPSRLWQSVFNKILMSLPGRNFSSQVFRKKESYEIIVMDNGCIDPDMKNPDGVLDGMTLPDYRESLYSLDMRLFNETGLSLFFPKYDGSGRPFVIGRFNNDLAPMLFRSLIQKLSRELDSGEEQQEGMADTIEVHNQTGFMIIGDENSDDESRDYLTEEYYYIIDSGMDADDPLIHISRYSRHDLLPFDSLCDRFMINANIKRIELDNSDHNDRIEIFGEGDFIKSFQDRLYGRDNEALFNNLNERKKTFTDDKQVFEKSINDFIKDRDRFNSITSSAGKALKKMQKIIDNVSGMESGRKVEGDGKE